MFGLGLDVSFLVLIIIHYSISVLLKRYRVLRFVKVQLRDLRRKSSRVLFDTNGTGLSARSPRAR
jgi:hypothetical protein